jgi:uncharacterized LabA/DUF88 family protein
LVFAWGEKTAAPAVFSFMAQGRAVKSIIYIDGYNLYYGCLKHSADKWLDIHQLFFERILRAQAPHSRLLGIKFFTADVKARIATHGQAAQLAQQAYHRALETLYPDKIRIIKGYYSLEKARLPVFRQPPDKAYRVDVWRLEEKQTDVNLALEAYRDAVSGRAEQLVFVSSDSDIAPALAAIRDDLGDGVKLGVILPIRAESHRPPNQQLSKHANWTRSHITDQELAQSHLPETIPTRKKPIRKPHYWS